MSRFALRAISAAGVALVIGVTLTGCGQKGPLYLPGDADSAAPVTAEQE